MAAANAGTPPGRLAFESETGIGESGWRGVYWARWNDAVREAGLVPNKVTTAYPPENLLKHLARVTQDIGHVPTFSELRLEARKSPGFPSEKTFARLGSKPEMIARLLTFCRSEQGLGAVAVICEKAIAEIPPEGKDDGRETEGDGFVYLIKSGRHYKIGRTNDPDRRERELLYQTVDRNVRVHTIRTDDPAGIEMYWQRRFVDKRVRPDGEWFALNARDVAAFCRRKKFM